MTSKPCKAELLAEQVWRQCSILEPKQTHLVWPTHAESAASCGPRHECIRRARDDLHTSVKPCKPWGRAENTCASNVGEGVLRAQGDSVAYRSLFSNKGALGILQRITRLVCCACLSLFWRRNRGEPIRLVSFLVFSASLCIGADCQLMRFDEKALRDLARWPSKKFWIIMGGGGGVWG